MSLNFISTDRNLCRFLIPDWSAAPAAIPYASLANPQSLNLYDYGLDNPVTNIDLFGHVTTKNCDGSSNQNGKGCGKKKSESSLKAEKAEYEFEQAEAHIAQRAWNQFHPAMSGTQMLQVAGRQAATGVKGVAELTGGSAILGTGIGVMAAMGPELGLGYEALGANASEGLQSGMETIANGLSKLGDNVSTGIQITRETAFTQMPKIIDCSRGFVSPSTAPPTPAGFTGVISREIVNYLIGIH